MIIEKIKDALDEKLIQSITISKILVTKNTYKLICLDAMNNAKYKDSVSKDDGLKVYQVFDKDLEIVKFGSDEHPKELYDFGFLLVSE